MICRASTISGLLSIKMHPGAQDPPGNDRIFSCLRHHPAECLGGLLKPTQDGVGYTRREVPRKLGLHFGNGRWRTSEKLFDDRFSARGIADLPCGAVEVPALDAVHLVMSVLAEQSHRQFDFVAPIS